VALRSYLRRIAGPSPADGPTLVPCRPLLQRWEAMQGPARGIAPSPPTSPASRASPHAPPGVAGADAPVAARPAPATPDMAPASSAVESRPTAAVDRDHEPVFARPMARQDVADSARVARLASGAAISADRSDAPAAAPRPARNEAPRQTASEARREADDAHVTDVAATAIVEPAVGPEPPTLTPRRRRSPRTSAPRPAARSIAMSVLSDAYDAAPHPATVTVAPAAPSRSAPRRDAQPESAPVVRIGNVDVHIVPPASPAPPPRPAPPAPASAAPLCRGLATPFGLRQG